MGNIKREIGDKTALYNAHGINDEFDRPNTYDTAHSHFGNGRYPPDWEERRDAIWSLQNHRCGRCGRKQRGQVHHIEPVEPRSGEPLNDLDNLIGLCEDCHKLIHPNAPNIDGSVNVAPPFPSPDAEEEVAFIKKQESTDFHEGFKLLESKKGVNEDDLYVMESPAVYSIQPSVAKSFSVRPGSSWASIREKVTQDLVHKYGILFPAYDSRELTINTPIKSTFGWLSSYEPKVSIIRPHPNWQKNSEEMDTHQFKFLKDSRKVTFEVVGGDETVHEETVHFEDDEWEKQIEVPVSSTPLQEQVPGAVFGIIRALIAIPLIPIAALLVAFGSIGMVVGAISFPLLIIAKLIASPSTPLWEPLVGGIGSWIMATIGYLILEYYDIVEL